MATQINSLLKVVNVTTRLNIRESPSTDARVIGKLSPGTENIRATQEENGWYFLADYNGWSKGSYLEVTMTDSSITTSSGEAVTAEQAQQAEQALSIDEELDIYIAEKGEQEQGKLNIDEVNMTSMRGIWGAPYQFMDNVDYIPTKNGIKLSRYGRTYTERIVKRAPLMFLAPGKVNFAGDYSSELGAAGRILDLLESEANEIRRTMDDMLLDTPASISRYYTFDFDWSTYYRYVDAGLRAGAQYLGIDDVEVEFNGVRGKLGTYAWSEAAQKSFGGIYSNKEYVGFFVDSANTRTESMTNETTDSSLLSGIQELGGQSRELQFLTGITSGKQLKDLGIFNGNDPEASVLNTIDDISKKYFNDNKVLRNIASNFTTIALGGQLIFPQIWASSSYSSSVNVSLKLRTPDCDDLSWYLNIYVPLYFLICMTAPRQADNPNGYGSPFLVRGYLKGLFNIDMGMLSLNITKGKESAWTLSGLPTEIDVDIEIKDMYSILSLTDSSNAANFVNNIGLMSYIANTCGVNFVENDVNRVVAMYAMLEKGKWGNIGHSTWSTIENKFSNMLDDGTKWVRTNLFNI